MKKINSEKIIRVMELTVFALLLAEAYFNHKDEINESVARLKGILNDKGEQIDGQQTTED